MDSPYINIHSHNNIHEPTLGIQNFNLNDFYENNCANKFSIGLHPWFLNESNLKNDFQTITQIIENKNAIAIGECGLDRICETNFDLQIKAFLLQLKLAEKENKIIIAHCVKSFSDFLKIFKENPPQTPIIFHSFSGNEEVLKKLLKYDVYFSFGKNIFNSKDKACETIKKVPITRLFLETDDSNITIEEVYLKTSLLINLNIKELKNKIYYSYKKLVL